MMSSNGCGLAKMRVWAFPYGRENLRFTAVFMA